MTAYQLTLIIVLALTTLALLLIDPLFKLRRELLWRQFNRKGEKTDGVVVQHFLRNIEGKPSPLHVNIIQYRDSNRTLCRSELTWDTPLEIGQIVPIVYIPGKTKFVVPQGAFNNDCRK